MYEVTCTCDVCGKEVTLSRPTMDLAVDRAKKRTRNWSVFDSDLKRTLCEGCCLFVENFIEDVSKLPKDVIHQTGYSRDLLKEFIKERL